MHTHDRNNDNGPKHGRLNSSASNDPSEMHQASAPGSRKAGYELSDANVRETATFLIVLGATLAVVFVLAFGIGKLIYMGIARQDGPTNKWSEYAGVKPANLESDPQIQQQQLQEMVKRFPTPRLQTDDGEFDIAEMHTREDMLLDHYSWVNDQKQAVRIPIDRAMQLLAQRGLAVQGEQTAQTSHPQPGGAEQQHGKQPAGKPESMFGDEANVVTAPLTNGFARTGPELQMMDARQQALENGSLQTTQSELHPAK